MEIIVDLTGPDWEPTPEEKYFAQVAPEGPYAFGPTPEAAREALVAKLATVRTEQ